VVGRYSDKQVIDAAIRIARKKGINILEDKDFRRSVALVILANRGLTLGGGKHKI